MAFEIEKFFSGIPGRRNTVNTQNVNNPSYTSELQYFLSRETLLSIVGKFGSILIIMDPISEPNAEIVGKFNPIKSSVSQD